MHVCTIVLSQTVLTASGRPFSPSQTSMHTSRTPRFLISDKTRSQNLGQVANRPVYLALGVTVDRVDEDYRVHRIQGPVLPFTHAFHDAVGDSADRLLGHLRAVH